MTGPIVSMRGFSWRYAGSSDLALEDVDFAVRPGECVVVCGASGCGKSTLVAALCGLIPHTRDGFFAGMVTVAGVDVLSSGTYDIARHVGSVFQDPRSQFFTTTTTDEVAFGCENLGLQPHEIVHRVDAAFAAVGAEGLRDCSIFELSSGQKQRIAIASALAMDPEVVVMDEPSANLDNEGCAMLRRIVSALKAQGRTVIIAEHRLFYVMGVADRVVRMAAGRIIEEAPCSVFRAMGLAEARLRNLRMPDLRLVPIEGRELLDACSPSATPASVAPVASAATALAVLSAPALEARGLTVSFGRDAVLRGASFSLAAGAPEVVAVIGKNGAGKTTLARAIAGLKHEDAGTVSLDGTVRSPRERTTLTSFVMQDADYQLFCESVEAELRFARRPSSQLDERVDDVLAHLGLEGFRAAHPLALSGGQKQRVTIACAAVGDERVVLFDEPTSGLDGGSMREVAALVRGLAAEGRRVLVITHDFEFIACCCTRALVVADGRIAEDFAVTEQAREWLYWALGLTSFIANEEKGIV